MIEADFQINFSNNSIVPVIKESELMAQKPKTFNFMRLRELLLQNSTNANLVVM